MDKNDVIDKHFSRAFMGYDIQEVDAFLDELIRELERRDHEREIITIKLNMLTDELRRQGLYVKDEGGDDVNDVDDADDGGQSVDDDFVDINDILGDEL